MKKSKQTTTSSSSSSSMNIHNFTHDLLNPDLISRFTSPTPPSSSSPSTPSSPSKTPAKVNVIDCFDSNLYHEPTTNARYVDIQGDQEDASSQACVSCGQIDIIDFLTKQCYLCNQKTISTTQNSLFTLLNQTNPTTITISHNTNSNTINNNSNNTTNSHILENSINKKRPLEEKHEEKHEETNLSHNKPTKKSPTTQSTSQLTSQLISQLTSQQSFSKLNFPLNLFPFLQTSSDQTLIIPNDEEDPSEELPTKNILQFTEDSFHRLCKHCHQIKSLKDFEPRRRVCLSCRNKKKVESAHAKILERLLEQTKQLNESSETNPTNTATTSSTSNAIKEPIYFEFPKPHRGNLPIECHECKQPFNLETCHLFRYRVDVCKYRSQCYACYNNKNYHYKSRKIQKYKESLANINDLPNETSVTGVNSDISNNISSNNTSNNTSNNANINNISRNNINNYSPLVSITIPVSVNNTTNDNNNLQNKEQSQTNIIPNPNKTNNNNTNNNNINNNNINNNNQKE